MGDEDKSLDKLKDDEQICKRINSAWLRWQNYAKDKLERYSIIENDYYSYRKPQNDSTKSCTFIPRTFEIVDIIRSRLMETMTSSDYYGIAVRRAGDKSAQALTALINFQLDKDDFYIKTSNNLLDVLLFGQLFYKIPWDRKYRLIPKIEKIPLTDPTTGKPVMDESGKPVILGDKIAMDEKDKVVAVRQKVFDQPTITRVSPFDFFASMDEQTIEECEFAGSRFYANLDEMKEKGIYDEKVLKQIEADDVKPNSQKWQDEYRQNEREATHLNYPEGSHKKYEWLEACTKDKIYVTLRGNNKYLVRNDDNVYMENIYKCAYIKPAPNEFLKIGLVEPFLKLQHTINALADDYMDIVNMITALMFITNEDALDENDYVARQGNILRVRGQQPVDNAIKIFFPQVDLNPIMTFMQYLNSALDTATGAVEIMKAVSPPGDTTATEFAGLQTQMSLRIRDMLCMLEYTYLRPVFKTFHKLDRVFMNEEEAVLIVKDGQIIEDLTVDPEVTIGDAEFQFLGVTREAFKSVQVQQAIQALQVTGQIPPQANPVQKLIIKLVLRGLVPRMDREIDAALQQMDQMVMGAPLTPPNGGANVGGGAPLPEVSNQVEQVTQTAQQNAPEVVSQ